MVRPVSNEEFEREYKNPANQGVIRAVLNHYRGLPLEERKRCAMNAVWRCLQYFKPEYNQKFSTSLHRFLTWECNTSYQKVKRERAHSELKPTVVDEKLYDGTARKEALDHLFTKLGYLTPDDRQIIVDYYLNEKTLGDISRDRGCCKEWARRLILKAVNQLRRCSNS